MLRRLPVTAILLSTAGAAVAAVLVLQVLRAGGLPDPTGHGDFGARILDISVLVFREGLECILVLSAITANLSGSRRSLQRPVAAGAFGALLATLVTWVVAIRIIDSLTESIPALDVQAATGLLAILVLLLVMNWFFHKVYWAGWISMHSRKKQTLLKEATSARLWLGLALLGFTSLYREGFEVVLFLQSYRLKLGTTPVLYGVSIGLALTTIVGVLTFVAHQRLPYRRMLVFTGVMLGLVLLSHGANLLIFTVGGLTRGRPPVAPPGAAAPTAPHADPLPQALILTAIVIGFAVLAFSLALCHRGYQTFGSDDPDDLRASDR